MSDVARRLSPPPEAALVQSCFASLGNFSFVRAGEIIRRQAFSHIPAWQQQLLPQLSRLIQLERAYYSFRSLKQLTDEYLELLFGVRHLHVTDLVSTIDSLPAPRQSDHSDSDGGEMPQLSSIELSARLARSQTAILSDLMNHLCSYLQFKAELARIYATFLVEFEGRTYSENGHPGGPAFTTESSASTGILSFATLASLFGGSRSTVIPTPTAKSGMSPAFRHTASSPSGSSSASSSGSFRGGRYSSRTPASATSDSSQLRAPASGLNQTTASTTAVGAADEHDNEEKRLDTEQRDPDSWGYADLYCRLQSMGRKLKAQTRHPSMTLLQENLLAEMSTLESLVRAQLCLTKHDYTGATMTLLATHSRLISWPRSSESRLKQTSVYRFLYGVLGSLSAKLRLYFGEALVPYQPLDKRLRLPADSAAPGLLSSNSTVASAPLPASGTAIGVTRVTNLNTSQQTGGSQGNGAPAQRRHGSMTTSTFPVSSDVSSGYSSAPSSRSETPASPMLATAPLSPHLTPPARSSSPSLPSPAALPLGKDSNAENSQDLAIRIRYFAERHSVYHASVVYCCAPGEPFLHNPPYQCMDPLNPVQPPTGMNSYPTVFRHPPDLNPSEHWMNVIAFMKQVDRFLGPLSPPFQFKDQRVDAVYWLCQLDPRHFLLLVYYTPPGSRKKRAPSTRSLNARRRTTRAFLQQISFLVRGHSVFSMLQGA